MLRFPAFGTQVQGASKRASQLALGCLWVFTTSGLVTDEQKKNGGGGGAQG
jgi:hypothetical protein